MATLSYSVTTDSPDLTSASAIKEAMSLNNFITPPPTDIVHEPPPVAQATMAPAGPDTPASVDAGASSSSIVPADNNEVVTESGPTAATNGGPSSPPETVTAADGGNLSAPESMTGVIYNSDQDDLNNDQAAPPLARRDFVCMNDENTECKTGQYSIELARKVISDHFGRNKACTRLISHWPLFCRKHYQRATYNTCRWQMRKIALILRQFGIIESEHPGTTYNVALKKSEEARLNDFSRKIAAGMDVTEAMEAVAPETGKHFEAPINVLRELHFGLGKGRTMEQVQGTVHAIREMLEQGETKQVPSIEFLPQIPSQSSAGQQKKKTAAKKDSSRISSKGGIKKTNKKA